MIRALHLAQIAYINKEVPVGAIIVRDNQIIAEACNQNRSEKNCTRHAEIIAIEQASSALNNERLTGCDIYVTKEPCSMCSGAIVHARIKRVIFGAPDVKYGACGSALDVCGNPVLNHRPQIISGILEKECSEILKRFFAQRRLNIINLKF